MQGQELFASEFARGIKSVGEPNFRGHVRYRAYIYNTERDAPVKRYTTIICRARANQEWPAYVRVLRNIQLID